MGKKREVSQVKKLFRGIKKKIRAAEIEAQKIQCECPHKSRNGKLWLKKYKKGGDRTIFKCRECDDKIDFTPIVGTSPKEVKKYVKQTCNDFMNLCNICKITISPKYDAKYAKVIGKAQFGAYQVKKIGRIALGEVGGKKNKHRRNKGRRSNMTINGGPISL